MHDLIVSSLQERRVDRRERLVAFRRETGRKCDGVLLGDADIECAVGEFLSEMIEARSRGHRRGDRDNAFVFPCLRDQTVGKDLRIARRIRLRLHLRAGDDVDEPASQDVVDMRGGEPGDERDIVGELQQSFGQARHQQAREGIDQADADQGQLAAPHILEERRDLACVGQQRAGALAQHDSGERQPQWPDIAVEQRRPGPRLQLVDRLGDGRLRQAKRARRGRHRAVLADREEDVERAQVEGERVHPRRTLSKLIVLTNRPAASVRPRASNRCREESHDAHAARPQTRRGSVGHRRRGCARACR